MVSRPTLIAVLVGVEVALVFAMVNSVRGDVRRFGPWHADAASAAPPKTYRFSVGAQPRVSVNVGGAALTVVTHAAPTVDVEIGHAAGRWVTGPSDVIEARAVGNDVRIANPDPSSLIAFAEDKTITVRVPEGAQLDVKQAGHIDVRGLRASVVLHSSNDAIVLSDQRGDVTATSDNGRLELNDVVATSVTAHSSNGRVMLKSIDTAHIDANSSNGRIEGTNLKLRDGKLSSSNGRISVGFAAGTDATVTAVTGNGRIRLNNLTGVAAADDADAAQTIRVGAGTGKLDLESSNGTITITQEG